MLSSRWLMFYAHLLNIISDAVDSIVGRLKGKRAERCKTTVSIIREAGAAGVSINGERLYFTYYCKGIFMNQQNFIFDYSFLLLLHVWNHKFEGHQKVCVVYYI